MKRFFFVSLLLLLQIISYGQRKIGYIVAPRGFERIEAEGFGTYLRNLPLKPVGTPVMLYNGCEKGWQGGAYSVIDMEIGTTDLQQCADAIMRLRAEYLWHDKRYSEIHFNFTNGMRVDYSKWAEGYRIKVSGNNTSWYKATDSDYSYPTFRKYLDIIFTYAGTASLSKEVVPVKYEDMQVGDIFIRGGHPGHAMIIVDIAADKFGHKAIMVAQSYMPAQDIHIVTNLRDRTISPWYIIDNNTNSINFPEWSFEMTQLCRMQ